MSAWRFHSSAARAKRLARIDSKLRLSLTSYLSRDADALQVLLERDRTRTPHATPLLQKLQDLLHVPPFRRAVADRHADAVAVAQLRVRDEELARCVHAFQQTHVLLV